MPEGRIPIIPIESEAKNKQMWYNNLRKQKEDKP